VSGELPLKAASLVGIAHKNTRRLLVLINDILDIEKMESGNIDFDFTPVTVRKSSLEQAMEANIAYGEKYDVKFQITDCQNYLEVYADRDRLMQVMNNLMSNAAKYEPSGGAVEISATRKSHLICISVTDHGPGIPISLQDRVFDKFTQENPSNVGQINSTGLGLAITKTIVEKHNVSYWFYNSKRRWYHILYRLAYFKHGGAVGACSCWHLTVSAESLRVHACVMNQQYRSDKCH